MKTILVRIFCLLLCGLLLLCPLIACDNGGNGNSGGNANNGNNNNTQTQNPDGKPTAQSVLHSFRQDHFGGNEFLIAAASSYENRFVIDQFPTSEEITEDMVQNELFKRDSMIEEYFGITLVYDDVLDSQMYEHISGGISAGDDEYSLVLASLAKTAQIMFNNDLLRNMYDFADIDLTASCWNKQSVDNFEIGGNIYMATGAITNRYVYAPYAMLFNSRLIVDLGLESPYTLVDENDWTLEVFAMMIEDTYVDDGNEEVGLEDFYGLAPASDSETAYYFACGGQLVAKNGNTLIPVYEEEENYDLLQTIIDMYRTDDVLKFKSVYDSNVTFNDGRAIFHSTALCDITMLSEMKDNYGIVPMPKYSADQENYVSNANRSISTMAVLPRTVQEPESVGLIVQALAAVSEYTSLDKQYDTVLLSRQALDAQSKRNLQLVVESVSYDWGYAYDIGRLKTVVADAILQGSTGVADSYASIRDVVENGIAELLAKFAN